MNRICALLLCFPLLLIVTTTPAVLDTINTTHPIKDGDILVSAGGTFALGFFSPGSSENRQYLGMWYNQIPVRAVVWVANRETPIANSSGSVNLTNQGLLVLLNQNGSIVWSSNTSRPAKNPIAQFFDSGNLVVRNEGDENPENFLWQSFDYPSDTVLAEMKLGRNILTGIDRCVRSWKTLDDPSPGNFTLRLETGGYPEITVTKDDSVKQFRSGPWNGLRFSGVPQDPSSLFWYEFVFNDKEMYFSYHLSNTSFLMRGLTSYDGIIRDYAWTDTTQTWVAFRSINIDDCDSYARCGAYGSCNVNTAPVCSCLKGFVPKTPKEWDMSNGCVRKTQLNCTGDGFQKFSSIKLPETKYSWYNKTMNLDECKSMCMKNCSCTAYANSDIRNGGSGCFLWFSDLIDMRHLNKNGQDIFIRMAASDIGMSSN